MLAIAEAKKISLLPASRGRTYSERTPSRLPARPSASARATRPRARARVRSLRRGVRLGGSVGPPSWLFCFIARVGDLAQPRLVRVEVLAQNDAGLWQPRRPPPTNQIERYISRISAARPDWLSDLRSLKRSRAAPTSCAKTRSSRGIPRCERPRESPARAPRSRRSRRGKRGCAGVERVMRRCAASPVHWARLRDRRARASGAARRCRKHPRETGSARLRRG